MHNMSLVVYACVATIAFLAVADAELLLHIRYKSSNGDQNQSTESAPEKTEGEGKILKDGEDKSTPPGGEERMNNDEEEKVSQKMQSDEDNDTEQDEVDCNVCGVLKKDDVSKPLPIIIMGKEPDKHDEYPWMVSIRTEKGEQHNCGGALISEYYILTAAHCTHEPDIEEKSPDECVDPDGATVDCYRELSDIQVAFVTKEKGELTAPLEIEKVINHPDYDINDVMSNDMSLLKLKEPLNCSSTQRPICLPTKSMKIPEGTELTTSGWGRYSENETMTEELREATLVIQNTTDCEFSEEQGEIFLCLKAKDKEVPCDGDSGSPVFKEEDGKMYIFGTYAYHNDIDPDTSECRQEGNTVFASVLKHLDWVKKVTGL